MNFNSKRSVTDEQNERHKRMLAAILKEEGNKSCADCKTRNPTWASVNLGVFVCLTCSGIHRSLGVHISQVRSCNLDTWLPKQVEFCRIMGNVKGNRYWEARLPKDFRRPPSGNPNPELAAFIRAKYVDRAYAATDVAQPPTIDDYLDHPYAKDDASNSSAASSASAAAGPAGASLLRGTPNKASASSPALTMDLLGGFDELASGPSCSSATAAAAQQQQQQAAAAANSDPFSAFGTFVSAPPPSSSGAGAGAGLNAQRNSLEWTDFHSATDFASAPPTTALHPQALPPPPSAAASAAGHHRSYSISEGVPTAPSSAGSSAAGGHQPSRFSAAAAGGNLLGSTMPAPSTSAAHHNHHGHHHNHQGHGHAHGHAAAGTPQPAAAPMASPPPQPRHQASGSDPFAGLTAPPDDLLAGLTIHHVMESFATPSAASSTGGAPPAATATTAAPAASAASAASSALDDLFTFSSSATLGDLPPPGAGHRRRPSQAKAGQEEVLRLFDAAPSTSSASVGAAVAAAVASSSDPFGDFLSAAPAAPAANGHTASNGLGLGGVPNLL
ncbi:hypothetical protein HXX76_011177 [Chlamydomonas incerta]|uniref:Arf-GAP domain-containing protein n=1 Tax=Chlamydomonas incerta TaxID=51695 RepID=A0A835SKU5_CHLIN|nr:hypothetical protein HXX76_011177 [Chlamydomonas incerta]|eukprot:KAG2428933.1 hypothetical protein HXX76_011177 [Chlamydomonas incerta]